MNRELSQALNDLTQQYLIGLIRSHTYPNFNGFGDHFSCPNPAGHKRGDRRPSASMYRAGNGTTKWRCFGCGAGSDIVDYYRYVSGMNVSTFPDVVKRLCEELGIDSPINDAKSSERQQLYAIARAASEYITAHPNAKYLNKRKIAADCAAHIGLGSVPGFTQYRQHLITKFPVNSLKASGYLNPMVFNERSIIMTIKNHYGQPIGFVARNMEYDPDSDDEKLRNKYCNTKANLIYTKGQTFYMLAHTRNEIMKQKTAYVVEGYLDGVTMYQKNIKTVAALGGVAFTNEHLKELKNLGVTEIIFCWDVDPIGIMTTIKKIEKVFIDVYDIRVRFLILPGAKDADEYLQKHTVDSFYQIRTYDAIEYLIKVLDKTDTEKYFRQVFRQMGNSVIGPHKLAEYADQISALTSIRKDHIDICLRRYLMSGTIDEAVREKIKQLNEAAVNHDAATVLLISKELATHLDTSEKSIDSLISEGSEALSRKPIITIEKREIYGGDINVVGHENMFLRSTEIKEVDERVQVLIHFHYGEDIGTEFMLREQVKAYKLTDDQKAFLKKNNIMLIQSKTLATPLAICSQIVVKDPNAKCIILTKDKQGAASIEHIPMYVGIII